MFFFLPSLTCSPVSFTLPPSSLPICHMPPDPSFFSSHHCRSTWGLLKPAGRGELGATQSLALWDSRVEGTHPMKHGNCRFAVSSIIFLQSKYLGFKREEIFCVFRCIRIVFGFFWSVFVVSAKIWLHVDTHFCRWIYFFFFATRLGRQQLHSYLKCVWKHRRWRS